MPHSEGHDGLLAILYHCDGCGGRGLQVVQSGVVLLVYQLRAVALDLRGDDEREEGRG